MVFLDLGIGVFGIIRVIRVHLSNLIKSLESKLLRHSVELPVLLPKAKVEKPDTQKGLLRNW